MSYTIELTKKSRDFLKRLEKEDATAILRKIYSLQDNPFPMLKKLKGTKLWRLRIGKYRAVLDVIIKGNLIIVLRIGKRSNVYD